MTYPDPPKKSVLNDVLVKVNAAIERKHMPFAHTKTDMAIYRLDNLTMVEILMKNVNAVHT